MSITLASSPVIFDENSHSYFHPVKRIYLSGITGVLKRHLFADMYDNIPEHTLAAAAERGHDIHSECMEYATLGIAGKSAEVHAFADLLRAHKITPAVGGAEYTVSDEQHFASKIDLVDDCNNLYDIKTTSSLNKEYVSWQLSIYAYLFELQNPGLKAGELYALHLRDGKARRVKVARICSDECKRLLEADADGLPFIPEASAPSVIPSQEETLATIEQCEDILVALKKQMDEAEARKKAALAGITEGMEREGLYKIETPRIIITRVAPSETMTLDSKTLKAELPDVYARYARTSTRAGYTKITLKTITNI